MGVSVVVPVYRSTRTLEELVARIRAVLTGRPYEIVLVDDGSPGDTWQVVRGLVRTDGAVVGLRLGRNAGQHAALLAGLRAARFPITVTLDDDLQNPPEEIPRLLGALEEGRWDLVYGTAQETAAATWRRIAGTAARRLLTRVSGLDLTSMSSFRVFRTDLRDAAQEVSGPRVTLDPILQWGTDRIGRVEVAHLPRTDGRSGYTLRSLLAFTVDMMTGYSTRPLRATTWLGFASALFGLAILGFVLLQYFVLGTSATGFPFIASTIALFAGAQLVALGVIGEYLARIHLRSLGRPTYVVAEVVGSAGSDLEGRDR